jgi:exosortase
VNGFKTFGITGHGVRTKALPAWTRFVALLALSLALWRQPLASTLGLALRGSEYTHILLILPLSLALIYTGRKTLGGEFEPSLRLGGAFLTAALLAAGVAWGETAWAEDMRLFWSMFGLVIWWIGSALLCFGTNSARALLFPLCFLFWIVPLPEILLGGIAQFLQDESAFVARVLFRMVGTPATQDGIMLSIPGLDIEVARQCSSIRSSMMLAVTTMFMAQLFLRSWWRKALLIAAAVPLSVAKNGLRILVISELGTRVDPGFLNGRLHHHGGVIFLAVSFAVVAALLWILQRAETRALPEVQGLRHRD